MRFLAISIDVEPDCSPSWRYSDPLTFDGVRIGIGQRLQPLFNTYGLCPTYLINNVVLEDPASVEVLRSLPGRYELGAHLHPEFIEPEKQFTDYAGKKGSANQCHLPPEVEMGKMRNLSLLFERSFDRKARSFRAGRFSAGVNTIRSLIALGYLVDSSVTPHVMWDDPSRQMPVDHRRAPEQPYFVDVASLLTPAVPGEILEVPVSIMGRRRWLRSRPVWLRPVYATVTEMMALLRTYLQRYEEKRPVVLNMMFHNVEIIPGKSPYTRTEQECMEYLGALESFFRLCAREGFQSVGLSDLHEVFRSNNVTVEAARHRVEGRP